MWNRTLPFFSSFSNECSWSIEFHTGNIFPRTNSYFAVDCPLYSSIYVCFHSFPHPSFSSNPLSFLPSHLFPSTPLSFHLPPPPSHPVPTSTPSSLPPAPLPYTSPLSLNSVRLCRSGGPRRFNLDVADLITRQPRGLKGWRGAKEGETILP